MSRWPDLDKESRGWGVPQEERRRLVGAVEPMLYIAVGMVAFTLFLVVVVVAMKLSG
ncbi:MAG: hypothetical protein ACXW0R_05590 [Gaiellaceae bacterium]